MFPKNFNEYGNFDEGIWDATITELKDSILVVPPKNIPEWDYDGRMGLVLRLERLVRDLRNVGVEEIFIDGQFVTDHPAPTVIEGYFKVDGMQFAKKIFHARLRQANWLPPPGLWRDDKILLDPVLVFSGGELIDPKQAIMRCSLDLEQNVTKGYVQIVGGASVIGGTHART